MPPVVFEPTISAGERPKSYDLDRASTGTGEALNIISIKSRAVSHILLKFGLKTWTNKRHVIPNFTDVDTQTKLIYQWIMAKSKKRLTAAVAQLLRCRATNRKVAGSIPDSVIGIFHWYNPSDRTMALGSAQPLTEMSTRSISCG